MRENFNFYGYCSPTSGKYYIDGNPYFMGEDYRNEKRYKEYKDVGFNILLLQHENSYSGEDFETSACNLCMTEALKAGLDKIIVSDTRLKALCEEKELIGDNGKFKSEDEFIKYLDFCTAPYRDKKGFYGIQLYDEPPFKFFKSYGKVVRGLKKILPNAFLQCNLLNLVERERLGDGTEPETVSNFELYERYLTTFLEESGMDSVMYDDYPFRRDYLICGNSLPNYQIGAKVAKKKGVEFHTVLQSFSWVTSGRLVMRRITESDMRWQANMCMGFGVKEYAFFTYFTKPHMRLLGGVSGDGIDGTAFINRDGTRTKLYGYAKKIMAEMKEFAPVILKYDYNNDWIFCEKGKTHKDFEQTAFAYVHHGCPLGVKVDKGVALVTEMKAKDDKSCLYMVENIGNIKDEFFNGAKAQNIKIGLNYDSKLKVYKRGKEVDIKIKNGTLNFALKVGDAVFIEIIK